MENVKYIFCIVFCLGMMNGVMAQSSTDLPALEKQLCFIQDTLYTLRQNYSCTNDAYMGMCYDTIYSVQASDKRYYLLAGTSRIATAYPLGVMQLVIRKSVSILP